MSHHHPSPGPSQSRAQSFHPHPKQKSKTYQPVGIAAGAEDVKYQAKYKELKRKVKEIETDNDKLQFKVLQAKRSIQRMKLERSILYERLSLVPPSPDIRDRQELPPVHHAPAVVPHPTPHGFHGTQHHRESRGHVQPVDPNDHALMEYIRTHGNIRVVSGPDGRPIPVAETPMGPGVAPMSHGIPIIASSRHSSNQGPDDSRQLPPLPQLAPVQQYEQSRGHGLSQTSPRLHSHSHPSSSHERSHSHSQRSPQSYGHQRPFPTDALPPVHHVLHSGDREREREKARRHDTHELNPGDHAHTRLHMPSQSISSSSMEERRLHRRRRSSGPGVRGDERELNREREWERERDHDFARERAHTLSSARLHSPAPRHAMERPSTYHDQPSSRTREESYYTDLGGYSRPSRSGTPGSGSGSGSGYGAGEGRPEGPYYDRDRTRFASVPANQSTSEELDWIHEDGRTRYADRGGDSDRPRPPSRLRKGSKQDMEVDDENGDVPVEAGRSSAGFSGGHVIEDRGSRRHLPSASLSSIRGGEDREDEDMD